MLKKLLENYWPTKEGRLINACLDGDSIKAELLLRVLNPNFKLEEFTPLYGAVSSSNIKLVELLLYYGADPDFKYKISDDSEESTALIEACSDNYTDILKLLIKAGGDVNAKCNGETALINAAENGNDEVARVLIENGADIEQRHGTQKYTPLYAAIWRQKFKIVKILLEAGANPNKIGCLDDKDVGDDNNLILAKHWGDVKIIAILLEYGAKA